MATVTAKQKLTAPIRHRMLKPDEAADYLSVTKQTLAVWRSQGRYDLPYVKIGRHIRYRQADLDKWIEQQTVRK